MMLKMRDGSERIKAMKDKLERIEGLKKEYEDIEVLIELGMEAQDESVIPEVENSFKVLQERLESFRIETLLNGQYDRNNAIFTIHSGAGGWKPRTGLRCCFACTQDGLKERVIQYQPLIC